MTARVFGSAYAAHPDVLIASLEAMNEGYRRARRGKLTLELERFYVHVFGVPEVGVQVRAMHFRRIMRKLPLTSGSRILDAGCGIGAYTLWMARSYPQATVVGCEVDREKLKFCENLAAELGLRNADFRYGDLTHLAWGDENFDLIVNIDVLEHLSDHKLALRTFRRLLKPGGYLYVHAPQPDQKRIFGRLESWEHTDHTHEGFKAAELSAEVTQTGFHVVDVRPTFGYLGKLAWELNHITLGWSLWIAAILFPLLNLVAKLDARFGANDGLGVAIIAQKRG